MENANKHEVELATYGAVLVVAAHPKQRPSVALAHAREVCDPIVNISGLRHVREIEGIAAFFGVNDLVNVYASDDGIRKSKTKGRSLFVQVVVPTWCLNQTTDEEFQEIVTSSVLYCLVMAARRFKLNERPIWAEYHKTLVTPRIKELFAPLN